MPENKFLKFSAKFGAARQKKPNDAPRRPQRRLFIAANKGFFMRIDKFLKVSRILKRRTVAEDACKAGKVCVNGREAKPAYRLKVGDVVELAFSAGSLKFRVLELKETVKKDEAASLYEIVSGGEQ